jgi:hypothetical protein
MPVKSTLVDIEIIYPPYEGSDQCLTPHASQITNCEALMIAKTPTYYALIEACALDGCPVCRVVHNSVLSYLDSFFYESVNDVQLRGKLRLSLGNCQAHVRLMLEEHVGDPLSFSIIYQDVLGNVLKGLKSAQEGAGAGEQGSKGEGELVSKGAGEQGGEGGWGRVKYSLRRMTGGQSRQTAEIQRLLSPPEQCLVCREQESATQIALKTLLKSIADPKMLEAVAESQGVCLPHVNQALQIAPDADSFAAIVRLSRQNLERLTGELAEFIRKNDHRFANERVGKEGDAWRRALRLASGEF